MKLRGSDALLCQATRTVRVVALAMLAGCPFEPAAPARCVDNDNCPSGFACVDGFCVRQDDPPTVDASLLDGGVVPLDGSRPDSPARDRDAAPVDSVASSEAGPGADGARAEAGATDRPGAEAASSDSESADTSSVDATSVDSGPACEPASCPVSSETCLLPTCGPSGCTFTVARENSVCPIGICRSGQCEEQCWIDSAVVEAGDRSAPGSCQACRPGLDPFAYSALDDNDPCDDGLWCTGSDSCSAGDCLVHQYAGAGGCSGGTPRCDEAGDRCVQCTADAHCVGTPGTPRCRLDTGTCVACLSPTDCLDDGQVCTTTECVNNVCGHVNNTLACTDGLWCTGTDNCSGGDCTSQQYPGTGGCSGGTPYCDEPNDRCVQCLSASTCSDDVNVCTTKVCTDGACGQSINTASCDDLQWCNGTDTCALGGCSTHQTTNVCSGVTYRTTCNEALNRCECIDTSCPAGWSCDATTKKCRRSEIFTLVDNNQDGYQDPYSGSTVLGVGELYSYMSLYSSSHVGGLRFQLSNVPAGATIVGAYLTIYVNKIEGGLDSPDLDIAAERVANAGAMAGNVGNELTSKTLTSASVRWLAAPLGVGWRNSPELKTVIQELLGLSGWAAGNYLLLVLKPRENTSFEFLQREANQPATLTVVHELP